MAGKIDATKLMRTAAYLHDLNFKTAKTPEEDEGIPNDYVDEDDSDVEKEAEERARRNVEFVDDGVWTVAMPTGKLFEISQCRLSSTLTLAHKGEKYYKKMLSVTIFLFYENFILFHFVNIMAVFRKYLSTFSIDVLVVNKTN